MGGGLFVVFAFSMVANGIIIGIQGKVRVGVNTFGIAVAVAVAVASLSPPLFVNDDDAPVLIRRWLRVNFGLNIVIVVVLMILKGPINGPVDDDPKRHRTLPVSPVMT